MRKMTELLENLRLRVDEVVRILRKKTTVIQIEALNGKYTGLNEYTQNPLISGSKILSEQESDLKFTARESVINSNTSIISDVFYVTDTVNFYKVNGATSNFTIDFSNYVFKPNSLYTFEFIISGRYIGIATNNIVVGTTTINNPIVDIIAGSGSIVISQIIKIITGENSAEIFSKSLAYGTASEQVGLGDSESTIVAGTEEAIIKTDAIGGNATKNLFAFDNINTDDSIDSTILHAGTRSIYQTSDTLLLKCNINCTIGTEVITNGDYYIPLFKVEE